MLRFLTILQLLCMVVNLAGIAIADRARREWEHRLAELNGTQQAFAERVTSGAEPPANYTLIHMPASGTCPAGFVLAEKTFQRRNDVWRPGCARVGANPGDGAIDRIEPGETVSIAIPLRQ